MAVCILGIIVIVGSMWPYVFVIYLIAIANLAYGSNDFSSIEYPYFNRFVTADFISSFAWCR